MDRFRKSLSESLITRFISYCLITQLVFPPLWVNNVYAALVTDPHAAVSFRPQIDNTYNIPVINIVAPNNTGLSHNKYQDFDVDINGLVFNNSLVTGNSRLAGSIVANPLFGGRTASIILNEVTGASDSELKGLMEVFGDKANVIIANPNGITCNGCGFINTQRGTLTTGTPDLSQGKLRFDVDGGLIRFEEEGHSYRSFINEMDVLSQYIDINGDISTKDRLSLVAGRFVFDYSKSMAGGSLTEWVEPKSYDAAKDSGRDLAVDGTIFGAMQSGQIDVMGTEQGLGVKVDGYLFAQADDLFIQSAGGLTINNADAVREIKLSAAEDIVIGADLIANLAIKAEAESIATTEETNLIANNINLNAGSDINLKGEIKTLELDVSAKTINVDADLLAINSLSFQSDNVTKIDDSTIGTRKADFITKEFLVKDTSFNITELSIQSEKTTIHDSAIDASTVTLNLGNVISNKLNFFAEVAEVQTKDWKGGNSQWNITNLNLIGDQLTLTNSSWLVGNGNFNVKDIALANTTLFSYASHIQSSNFSSTSSKVFAENLSLNITNTLSSISDEWQVLPFNDESTTANAGRFELNSKVADFTNSIIRADKYAQVSEKSNFINAGIAANSLDIKSGELNADEKALWIANEKVDVISEQANLSGAIKTTNINLISDNANISGQWLIAETADIQSKNDLNFKDIGLSAKSLITSFEKGSWDNLIAKTQSNSITASQSLALAAATLESATLSVTAETLELDNKTWVGANETQINTRELNNAGTLLTADKLTINSGSINNAGEIASFKAIEIQNENVLDNSGRIIANDLLLKTNALNNSNSIGSENLELVYQNITNTKDAVISSENATYTAKTNTANFENYGTQIAGDSMSWLSLQDKSGQYTNAGLLSGSKINFAGLNSVTNGVLLDGEIKGTIQALTKVDDANTEEKSTEDAAAVGTLLIGSEEFTQLGTIKANQITIERDDFHNEGIIHSDKLTANTDTSFINSGVIAAQAVDIKTAAFTNNESSTVSATDTKITNANVSNSGKLISTTFDITAQPESESSFTNTSTGILVQNSSYKDSGDGSQVLVSLGNASLTGFDSFTNSGLIEADGLLSIKNIKSFTNSEGDLTDLDNAARIVSKTGIELKNIDIFTNEAVLVSNALAVDAYSINNSGIIGAGEASINITQGDAKTGKLTNSGKIYQSDLVATQATRDLLGTSQGEFNISTIDFDNLATAAIEIKKGNISLNNGDLINSGLISEINDDDSNTNLQLTGIKNLENRNDISVSTDLKIADGGSIKNLGKDSYIRARNFTGGTSTDRLSSIVNEGSILITNNVGVLATTVINDTDAKLLANTIDINTGASLDNKGVIGAEGELTIASQNLTNAVSSEIYSLEKGIALKVNSQLNNSGQILAKTDAILNTGSLNNAGVIQSHNLILETRSAINNQGEESKIFANTLALTGSSISNDGLIHGNESLIVKAAESLNNNLGAKLTSLGILQIKSVGAGENLLSVNNSGIINTNGLSIDSKNLTSQSGATIAAGEARITATSLVNKGIVYQTGDQITAGQRALLSSSDGAFDLNSNTLNNLGSQANIDIKKGIINTTNLINEGNLRERETGANAGDNLVLANVKNLNNTGEIVLYSDLLLANAAIKNTGSDAYLRAKSITANNMTEFGNSGKIAAQNKITLDSKNNLVNSGEIVAKDLKISSDQKITNNKLLQAQDLITLNANQIDNTTSAEISTTSATSNLSLSGANRIDNTGLVASRGDLTVNTQSLVNSKNISASKATTLNVGNLGNTGLIFGESLTVGSAAKQFASMAQPVGISSRSFSVGQQKGLVASKNLTLYTQGILNDVYQATNINIHSNDSLTLNGSIVAKNQANISSADLTINGQVDIATSNDTSTWNVQNTLTNNGIINSKSKLLLNSNSTINNGAINTEKELAINTSGFTNKSSGNINSKGKLTISGKGGASDDRSGTFTNKGNIVADQGFDLSANTIKNSNNIKASGDSQWYFLSLVNDQGKRISVDGDWKLGTSAKNAGSISNFGKLYGSKVDFYGTSLFNGSGSQFVAFNNDLNLNLTSSLNNYGSLYGKNAFNIRSEGNINNNGVIESFSSSENSLIAQTINNGNGTNAVGKINTKGNLTITANVLNNNSHNIGGQKKKGIIVDYTLDTGSHTYFQLDFIDVTYYEKAQSSINVQGKLKGKGHSSNNGIWNNLSSSISADYIDISGLSDVNNETQVVESKEVFVEWYRQTKSKKNKKRRGRQHDKFVALSYEDLAKQIDSREDGYYWDVWGDGPGRHERLRVLNDNPNVSLGDTNVAIIHARTKLEVGKHTNITNTGNINAAVIDNEKLEDKSNAANVAVLNGDNSDGTSTSANTGATGSASGDTNVDGTSNQNTGESTDNLDETNDHIKGSFVNGADGIVINVANRQPTATIPLLSFIIPGLSFDALNAASVAGDKTPEELAAQAALQAQLNGLDNDKQKNSKAIKGQTASYNAQAPSLFDLDEDILARIIADTEYELSPEYIFDKVDPDRSLDAEPKFFLDPYQEAQAVTQAALQQTGTAFFSPDWSTSADQRKGLYDNTLEYLGTQQNVTLGKALTPMQVKQLEQPMIWYVSMNIGGQSQLVPTVYLPEATLDQITTPSAGTLIADSMDIDVSNFKNTGNIKVANSARIQADVITNQRNVMTFGDERNYGAIAGTGGNITAGDLALISRTDINNNGGSLTSKNSLLLDAQGDIHLNALELKRRTQNGKNINESTDFLLSQINAGGDATVKAGDDINSQAAQAKIGGNGIFDATNINLLGVTERDYSKTVKKKKGTFSSSKKTIETEQLNFVGSDFEVGGSMVMNAKNDITMVGANVDVGKSAAIKAGNDITLTAGISTDKYSKQKSGSGVATTSSQQKGHIKETATGTLIKTGESLQIDSDGGDVAILASELNAQENLVLGDMNVKRDENGAPIKDENGQYITEDGSSINNLTIGTVELKDESWNKKSSGLKGPLKDLAAVAAFTLSASGLGQAAMAAGLDTEIEVGKTSESRVESTTHATSTVSAGETLAIKTDGDFRMEGSQANATNASIETGSTTITAVENTTTTTESESTHTVGATKGALKKDEVTVAGSTETKHTETTTTTDTELVKAGLNVSENLAMNSVENIDILGSDVNVGGNAEAKAKTITVAGLKEQTTTKHKEKTETTTTSVGVKNAYVDTALAIQAVADAGAAVDAAQSALDQAKRDVKNGTLQANAIGDYEANLAAATTQLGQATLSAAASGAAAAATTGTGGFYATGSAEKTITEKTSTDTEERYIGSSFNVGGDASFDATHSIDIIGSNMDIGGGLALNAKDVTIKAGVEETTSTSSETTRTAGSSYSTNGGASANASGSNTDSDSYSKTHINSTINAGILTSTSDKLTLSGANVEVAGGIDIDTGNLVIESLQDESSSSSKTEGYSVGAGVSASSMNPSALGANENSSSADSQWVNNQTTLIGGTSGSGDVNISADKTTLKGAVVASATRNEDGTLTDNGTLNLATDELIIEDIKDKDHSENKGFDISAGLSSSGSSTVGLTSDGHKKEQTTLATLGGGNITKKDGSAHEEGLVESANSDLNNSQEITKDMKTGGLNASVTIDHRLASENGRASIKRDVEDADNHFNDEILGGIKEAIDTGSVVAGAKAIKRKIDIRTGIVEVQTSKNDQVEKGLNDANGDVDAKQQAAQGLSDVLTDKAGVEKQELIVYSDASDKEGGFHSDKENITGINAAKTNMADGSDVAKTTVHETTHHTLNEQENSYSKQNKEDAAHNDGEYAQKIWKQQNERNGHTTGGSGKAWVANNKNSETLKSNTKTAATIPDEEREKLIPPVVVGIGLILGEISSANAPSEEDNLDEIPQSTSILPGDVALDAVSELANEHLPENVAAAVGVAVMVGKDPVKAIANLPETVGDLTKKTDAPKVDTDFEIGGKAKNPSKNEVEVTLEYKTNPKHDREELKRQAVEDQAKGIENMRAGEIKVGIEEYKVSGRPPLAAKTTKKVRKENPEDGRGKAVTHGPDCCMGNKGDKVTGYGGLPENASIGSQNKKNQSVAYDAVKDADPDASVKVKVIVDGEEIY